MELYSPLVATWCRHYGLQPADIADVLQLVFLSVSRSFDQFRIDSGSSSGKKSCFRAWLWTITRSRVCDWGRRQKPDQGQGGSTAAMKLLLHEDSSAEEPSTDVDKQSLMGRALAQIKPDFAEKTWAAFWRTVIDGQSVSVVSDQLQMKPASIRQAKSRVLRRLREQLGDL